MFALGIFGMFGTLILPLIFIAMIVASIRAIVIALSVSSRASREPACERCRYRVAGLSTFTCPECGTDLRQTGIITLPMEVRRRGSLLTAIAGWLYLMFLAGCIGLGTLSLWQFQPMMSAATRGAMVTTTALTPASGAYTRIDATNQMGPGGGSSTGSYALVLKDGSIWKLSFAPLGASYTITDPAGAATTTAPDDGKATDALFAAAGLDAADPKIAAESRELSTIIGVLSAAPYAMVSSIRLRALTAGPPAMTSGPAALSAPPDMTAYFVAMGVGSLLWLGLLVAGIVFIVSRRKKLLRQFTMPAHAVTQAALPPESTPQA